MNGSLVWWLQCRNRQDRGHTSVTCQFKRSKRTGIWQGTNCDPHICVEISSFFIVFPASCSTYRLSNGWKPICHPIRPLFLVQENIDMLGIPLTFIEYFHWNVWKVSNLKLKYVFFLCHLKIAINFQDFL